jgi:hypothetical protein
MVVFACQDALYNHASMHSGLLGLYLDNAAQTER